MNGDELSRFLQGPPRTIHFIGVGGAGMSALAKLCLAGGHRVTGSDLAANAEIEKLRKLGAVIEEGHEAAHLGRADLVVYSSAIRKDNPELVEAQRLQVPAVRRALVLAALLRERRGIAVSGTHGKTTTASMIAHVLRECGLDPTFCIGAHVPVLGGNAAVGRGEHFVAEVDESDGTLTLFEPSYAVITNIEAEHLDYFADLQAIEEAFAEFAGRTREVLFYCADDPQACRVADEVRRRGRPAVVGYGFQAGAEVRVLGWQAMGFGCRFEVGRGGERLGTVFLKVPGSQNVVNACGAVAVGLTVGLSFERVASALESFTGASRRFECRGMAHDVVVVDDYAHHPTEIRATIAAARGLGRKRLLVVFQPHRYSRTKFLKDQFATAFGGADELYLTDVYGAHEQPLEGVDGRALEAAVRAAGQGNVHFVSDVAGLVGELHRRVRPGDTVLVLGAGDIVRVAERLAAVLGEGLWKGGVGMGRSELDILAELRGALSSASLVAHNEPMSRRTTLRVGGAAQFYVEAGSESDLAATLAVCQRHGLPFVLIGRGSNLLVRDGGIRGVVIKLVGSEFTRVLVEGERVQAGAGARLKDVVAACKEAELAGLEFLEGIPGSVGGALRMNAGAMGQWMFEVVERVRFMDCGGGVHERAASEINVEYRGCPLFRDHIALGATLKGVRSSREQIQNRLRAFAEKRWSSQPPQPSAGCIFKNPREIPAGKLIDELGLKGTAVGRARVSEVHGNFIVNEGGATASEVLELIALIQDRAWRERGIRLEPEVIILGEQTN